MDLIEILDQLLDYQEFMTFAELDDSSKKLANNFEIMNYRI
ncbi:MAG: hypothetical protein ACFE9T_15060 [Promethearchaeota archaeon]